MVAASRRIYAQHAEAYAAAGLPAFPVNTRQKKPAIRGWQSATPRRTVAWSRSRRLGDADGIGIVMGKPSGVTEIDVDEVGEAWLGVAIERFGETPVTIRTASGKAKLWYRNNGEKRCIRPFEGQPIDVLGDGFTIAPPSWREDLAASYEFISGNLGDAANLPHIAPNALETGFIRSPGAVEQGVRNTSLWRYCMAQARYCDDVAALIDVAATWNTAFPDPLSSAEMERCARSAWGYETEGRNFLGLKRPQITEGDRTMDELLDYPEAFTLYQMFTRWHGSRPSFAIAPRAMSEAGSPPWDWRKITRARNVLLERGYLEELSAPCRGRKKPGQYRLAVKMHESVHNHYTPSPLETGSNEQVSK